MNKSEIKFDITLQDNPEQRRERIDKVIATLSSSKSSKKDREFAIGIVKGLEVKIETDEDAIENLGILYNAELMAMADKVDMQKLKELRAYLAGMLERGRVAFQVVGSEHINSLSKLIDKLESKI